MLRNRTTSLAFYTNSRTPRRFIWTVAVAWSLTLSAVCLAADETDAPAAGAVKPPEEIAKEEFFAQQVQPLLSEHCYECHSHEYNDASGELMLDSLAAMLRGGTRGAALVPGDAGQSVLIKVLSYSDPDVQMPPSEKLPDEQIEIFKKWIQDGAVVPDSMRGKTQSESQPSLDPVASHWAYQPPVRWQPTAEDGEQPIDQIIQLGLKAKSLEMSPPASRTTLLRRLCYDLTGLPPTVAEIAEIESDPRPDQEVIAAWTDRLLASEHFGERWARYWMDVARYADTKGYVFQEDREYPGAYQYRDWLINAFNQDMPYDEFVTKQIAADLISKSEDHSDLPALGFLTLGRRFLNNKQDIIDDRLDVVSRGLMGMTLACARCHDHKYDPISQADYYSMAGIFLNTDEPGGDPWPHRLKDAEESRQAFILIRGSAGNRGDKVDRRFVSFLAPEAEPFAQGSGRVELAREITSSSNPLTARVIANRVWLRMTGTSLVESPSDLGTRCPPPLQLTLLDHLATSLVDDGWSIKRLIRRIATSKTYQQQSLDRPECAQVDPQNATYWKMNRRRLDFEAFRDTLLARSEMLDRTLHGPSKKIDGSEPMLRRTVYAYIDRQNLPSVFRTFDFASPDAHNSQRALTSVPQQGLFVLNSDFVAQVAVEIGKRVTRDEAATDEARIRELFNAVLARQPNEEELQLASEFVAGFQPPDIIALERWQCGFANYDPGAKTLSGFQQLPVFAEGRWQGGSEFPDAQLGYCMLSAEGGHTGSDLAHSVVRRWIAPRDGEIRIRGQLKHSSTEGDGVRGTLLVAGAHHGEWTVSNSEQTTDGSVHHVKAGEAVDFVADCIGTNSHDSFNWTVRVRYSDGYRESYASKDQLPTPRPEPLDRWAQLAQSLLATNELAYVD